MLIIDDAPSASNMLRGYAQLGFFLRHAPPLPMKLRRYLTMPTSPPQLSTDIKRLEVVPYLGEALAERGRIRTSDTVLPVYRTEVRCLRPLSHLSLDLGLILAERRSN